MKNKTSFKKMKIIFTTIKLLIVLLFLNANQSAFAQEPVEPQVQEELEKDFYKFDEVDVKPEYPGGMIQFYNFIGKNYRAPEQKNLNGKVIIEFIIEKDGSLSNFKVARDLGSGTGTEAIRVLKRSPKWKPGILNEKPVRVLNHLPITIGGN